jgi:hypothetical protein
MKLRLWSATLALVTSLTFVAPALAQFKFDEATTSVALNVIVTPGVLFMCEGAVKADGSGCVGGTGAISDIVEFQAIVDEHGMQINTQFVFCSDNGDGAEDGDAADKGGGLANCPNNNNALYITEAAALKYVPEGNQPGGGLSYKYEIISDVEPSVPKH